MKAAQELDIREDESAGMELAAHPWKLVLDVTQAAQTRHESPFLWSLDIAGALHGADISTPSLELGHAMVQHLCSSGSHASLWAYLEHSMAAYLVYPVHVIALLTAKVIPVRHQQPELYSVYLTLAGKYVFSLSVTKVLPCPDRFLKAVDEALQLSPSVDSPITELGAMLVHFIFTMIGRLAEATAEDWSGRSDSQSNIAIQGYQGQGVQGMGLNTGEDLDDRRREEQEQLKRANGIAAIDLIAKLMENSRTAALIRLARRSLPEQWTLLTQQLQLLEALSRDISSAAPKEATEALSRLAGAIHHGLQRDWRPMQMPVIRMLLDNRSSSAAYGSPYGAQSRAAWLAFDIYMEDAMEGRSFPATSTAETLAELIRSVQAVQCASWHDTFVGLWSAALRLVNRGGDFEGGPRPRNESRLSVLLAIVPLAAGSIIEEEEKQQRSDGSSGTGEDKERKHGTRRSAYATSLQVLGQIESLLYPHPNAAAAANQAAAAAAAFVSSVTSGSASRDGLVETSSIKPVAGNLRHLIVESSIARSLLDTSAYFWPGMTASITSAANQPSTIPVSPWTSFMEGAPLTGSLRALLMSTPAASLAELEKVYHLAISGPEEDRASAASILCGASLVSGWKIQEHAVQLAVRLLSPPADTRNGSSYLISYASMFLAALGALNTFEVMGILSFYGVFPELAERLLPICEFFGGLPLKPATTNLGEDVSAYTVFSNAFLLLVRLWNFHRAPVEYCILGNGAPIGAEMNLECLLQLRNSQLSSSGVVSTSFNSNSPGPQLVSLDSYPKLKAWYIQQSASMAASLSTLSRTNPVHQHVDRLLGMMLKKQSKVVISPISSSNGMSGSEDISGRPILSAWEVMAATPYIVDAVLAACAHGKLAPRDLTTGLRELVDYLPATVASVVSYFTAEITRGLWKSASMNGNDWPSPAANLSTIESEIQDIVTSAGVQIPSHIAGSTSSSGPASLPLPLAALVSFTITFKQDKSSSLPLGVAGLALEYAAGGSPWPSMPVTVALWAQKVPKWHDFIVYIASKSIFKQSNQAVNQLLRSCFAATLGASTSPFNKLSTQGGVGALLGSGNYKHSTANGRQPVYPGLLYLRSYPVIHDISFLCDEILVLVAGAARDLATGAARELAARDQGMDAESARNARMRSAVHLLTQASALGASLIYVSGGTTLVQLLYSQTLPTWFMSGSGFKGMENVRRGPGGTMEGYAIAHFALLSAMFTWGASASRTLKTRQRVLGEHLDFIASGLEGKISIGCDQSYWKAYVVGYLTLMVTCCTAWIIDIKRDTLCSLARGLRFWHEHDVAVALLERGGAALMGATAEFVLGSFPIIKR